MLKVVRREENDATCVTYKRKKEGLEFEFGFIVPLVVILLVPKAP
jgi:hypothetical protein